MMNKPWQSNWTELKYEDHWMRIELHQVTLPNGKKIRYSVARLKGGIGVVAADDQGRICIVGQFRYAPGVYSWEIPKGAFQDFGHTESPLETAHRELAEETGLSGGNWSDLGVVHTLMGSSDDKVFLFYASKLDQGNPTPGPTEFLTRKMVSFREFLEMQSRGEITDATSIAAVLLAVQKGLLSPS